MLTVGQHASRSSRRRTCSGSGIRLIRASIWRSRSSSSASREVRGAAAADDGDGGDEGGAVDSWAVRDAEPRGRRSSGRAAATACGESARHRRIWPCLDPSTSPRNKNPYRQGAASPLGRSYEPREGWFNIRAICIAPPGGMPGAYPISSSSAHRRSDLTDSADSRGSHFGESVRHPNRRIGAPPSALSDARWSFSSHPHPTQWGIRGDRRLEGPHNFAGPFPTEDRAQSTLRVFGRSRGRTGGRGSSGMIARFVHRLH